MRFVKTKDHALVPFDKAACDWFARVYTAEPVSLYPVDEDDTRFRGYVFACIRDVAEAIKVPAEELRAELLLETGRFNMIGEMFGMKVVAVNSMSRQYMSEAELRKFWDEACYVIKFKLLCRVQNPAERERLIARLMPQQTEEAAT